MAAPSSGTGSQHPSKSSHPVGQFRDKSKYNNRKGRSANQDDEQEQQAPRNDYISQEKLTEHLTTKLCANKFVNVKTTAKQNARGTLYEIDVINPGLSRIGNGTFFTMKLHTVSHKSRVIFIRIIFNDDESRNADMRINADAIIQIFREIAPDTVESISITDVDDSKGNKHLAVIASTVKGASLNFTYERAMEFVHVVDEKYGSSASSDSASGIDGDGDGDCNDDGAVASAEDMTTDQIDAEAALLEKKLNALKELKLAKSTQPRPENAEASTDAANATNATQGQTKPHTRPTRITVGDKTVFVKRGKTPVAK